MGQSSEQNKIEWCEPWSLEIARERLLAFKKEMPPLWRMLIYVIVIPLIGMLAIRWGQYNRKASLPDGLCLPFAFSHGTTVSVPQRETGCFLVRHQFQFITADEQLGSKQQLHFQNFNYLAFLKVDSVESQENVLYYHRFQKSRIFKVLKVSV